VKISLTWLRDYIDLTASNDEISRAITFLGFEVEGIINTGAPKLDNVVVGEILTREKVPNLKKEISLCTVNVGAAAGGVKTIICGAHNCDPGRRVPVALPGAVLPGDFKITQSKKYGHESQGMLCGPDEIGLPPGDGLLILDPATPIGAPINDVLPAGDTVFDIEITPNRPDCQCHLGIARELAAWFKLPLKYPQEKFRGDVSGAPARPDLLASVRVESPEDCPLYTAFIISGVKISESPAWLKQRLSAVGLRPINNVVDVGNYVMLETGQPMHAFDARKLGGAQIVVRRATEGEKIITLDGKERSLTSRMLVIADAQKPVVVAGVMGGENSGVSADTTDLVLECAIFNRQSIRATSRALALSSDSSYRYERGVDPHAAMENAWRAIDLIIETAGGRVVGPAYKIGSDVPWQREIVVTHDYITDKLGFDVPAEAMRSAFEALEFTINREEPTEHPRRGPAWTVGVPSWRDDLDRPIDLVEEVLRLYGTEKIPATVVQSPGLLIDDDPIVLFNRRVTDYLVGQDFHECVNYTLRPAKELTAWVDAAGTPGLALANPFVEDQSHLRPTLVSGLLESLKLNQSRGVVASRLCETGRVFIDRKGEKVECAAVAFIIAEPVGERSWLKREPADFYAAKHLVGALATAAGIDFTRQPVTAVAEPAFGWQAGHAASAGVIEHGGWVAKFGLLSLAHLKSLGIEGKVYAGQFTILPEKLSVEATRRRFAEFSLQPVALRDLALVVDVATTATEVQKALAKLARAAVGTAFALETVSIFDVYAGPGMPEGKKSLAFSFVFRAVDRTLTDDEVNVVFNKIQDEVAKTTSWQIRK
jgi:phenylalanyl-tRNA synthetase beta chain